MGNLLTAANLLAGIRLWLTQKTNWPSDFHNQFYQDLGRLKQNGLNAVWWRQTLQHLSDWKAIRPLSKETIHLRGAERLGLLQTAYNQIIKSSSGQSLDLATATWESLEGLYAVAFDIKGVDSPVFGSKLCHFILPNAYPVIDRDVVGVDTRTYNKYWQFCVVQWRECSEREALQRQLRQIIGQAVYAEYPYSTKVTELCIIGSRV